LRDENVEQTITLTSKVEDVQLAVCKDCRNLIKPEQAKWIATVIMPENVIEQVFPLCEKCLQKRNRKYSKTKNDIAQEDDLITKIAKIYGVSKEYIANNIGEFIKEQ
jgi:protein-arginine kinase activator protein McsA